MTTTSTTKAPRPTPAQLMGREPLTKAQYDEMVRRNVRSLTRSGHRAQAEQWATKTYRSYLRQFDAS